MEKKNTFRRHYSKYTVTSLVIAATLLAVNPIDANAKEANENQELVETVQTGEEYDAEAALERGEAVLEKEEEVEEQAAVVEEAEEAVEQNQDLVQEAEETLEEVDNEIEDIEQEIEQLEEDAASTDELEQTITEGEAEAEAIETEIAEAEDAQEALQEEAAGLEEAVETAEQTVAEETAALEALEAERENLPTESAEDVLGQNEIVVPDGYLEAINNFSEVYATGEYTAEDVATVAEVALPGGALNNYVPIAEDEDVAIADPTNLENDIAIELAQFTAELLNPIRQALGNDLLIPNQDAIDMAAAIADTYERDKFNPFEVLDHHVDGITEVAGEYGLNDGGQYYENLGFASWAAGNTLNDLKRNIYNTIVSMLFDDAGSAHGHAVSLVGETNNGAAGFLGVSFSFVPAQDGEWDANNTHFITVPNTLAYLEPGNTFDTTANIPFEGAVDSGVAEELDRQIGLQQNVLAGAQANLAAAEQALNTNQTALATVEDEIASLNSELSEVNTRLDGQRARLGQLENIEAVREDLEDQLADAQARRDTAEDALIAAEKGLETAQAVLASEQALLTQLQEELAELKQEPYSFADEYTAELPFETERVENPDLAEGTEEVTQAGENGLLQVTEHTVYLGDEVIDQIIVAENVLVEPVPEIIEVGTAEAPTEPEDPLSEIENQIVELEEAVRDLEADNEALRGVLSSLQAELAALREAEAAAEKRIIELENRVAQLEAEVNELEENPAPVAPETPTDSEEADTPIDSVEDNVAADEPEDNPVVTVVEAAGEELPAAGAASSSTSLLTGIVSVLSGLGLMVLPKSRRK